MLTKRIAKLVSLVPSCVTLADVGCDHGYVGIEALKLGRVKRVTFVDVSLPSLDKARANCPQEYINDVSFVCQDGIKDVESDCAVIAGMGGLEIISILENAKHPPQKLVLQPMRNQRDVRKYLSKGYEITTDEKFYDYKYYDVIVAEFCGRQTNLTEPELEFGRSNLANPTEDFTNYLLKEQSKLTKILQGCDDPEVKNRLLLVNRTIAACMGG